MYDPEFWLRNQEKTQNQICEIEDMQGMVKKSAAT